MFYGKWWRSLISEASADLLRIKLLCRMVINALLSLTAVGLSSLRGSVPEAGQSREKSLNQEALPLIWISWNRQTLRLIGKSCNYLWNNLSPLFNLSLCSTCPLWSTGPFDELVPLMNWSLRTTPDTSAAILVKYWTNIARHWTWTVRLRIYLYKCSFILSCVTCICSQLLQSKLCPMSMVYYEILQWDSPSSVWQSSCQFIR